MINFDDYFDKNKIEHNSLGARDGFIQLIFYKRFDCLNL